MQLCLETTDLPSDKTKITLLFDAASILKPQIYLLIKVK
jgi:hypothetical protein